MFKYAPDKYSHQFLSLGTVRIGTLHDYRRSEHKLGIADPQEGKKLVQHVIKQGKFNGNDLTAASSPDARALRDFRIFKLGAGCDVTIENVTMGMSFDSPDCYILCLSNSCSLATMGEFQGADSCVRIKDIGGFFDRLTTTLAGIFPVEFLGVRQVTYALREEAWNGTDWGLDPVLLKDPIFEKQFEYRAIWIAKQRGVALRPIVLTDNGLVGFLERVLPA